MSKESQSLAKWVRMTLTQLGIDTSGLGIMIFGGTVQIKGDLKPIKPLGFESERTQKKRVERISQRLRNHKAIKRVQFL